MADKELLVCLNTHFDSVSLWLGSFGGEDSPCDISRGVHAARLGTPRLLDLYDKYQIKGTWDITGHSIESFPKEAEMVVKAGHEIGLHGYSHENPLAMSKEQESAVLDKTFALTKQLSGKDPKGYTAPWWELSKNTIDLLIAKGIEYDHSLMEDDHSPYYLRRDDSWIKIDYSKPAETWMKPWKAGSPTKLVEIPCSWYLDDAPPVMFVKKFPNSHGWVSPRHLGDMWQDQFDWVYRNYDWGIFNMCLHPDASGHPQMLMMLERLLDHMRHHDGIRFVTLKQISDEFKKRNPQK
ncbi:MAG: polysaccharide deacetylase [Alphaproteobacteria bacterium]|nr:polysaccharide deacetylase [Alphaproteobacteria bacterium]